MLVLTRKVGEEIMIGDNIKLTLVDIDRNKVRLGVAAPRAIPVYRKELLESAIDGAPATGPEQTPLPKAVCLKAGQSKPAGEPARMAERQRRRRQKQ